MWDEESFLEAIPKKAINTTHWVRIRKSRFKETASPWLVKLYPPEARSYFDYEESTRTDTFEQAIQMAQYFLGENNVSGNALLK
jgi:hypothetical protein